MFAISLPSGYLVRVWNKFIIKKQHKFASTCGILKYIDWILDSKKIYILLPYSSQSKASEIPWNYEDVFNILKLGWAERLNWHNSVMWGNPHNILVNMLALMRQAYGNNSSASCQAMSLQCVGSSRNSSPTICCSLCWHCRDKRRQNLNVPFWDTKCDKYKFKI